MYTTVCKRYMYMYKFISSVQNTCISYNYYLKDTDLHIIHLHVLECNVSHAMKYSMNYWTSKFQHILYYCHSFSPYTHLDTCVHLASDTTAWTDWSNGTNSTPVRRGPGRDHPSGGVIITQQSIIDILVILL